MLIPLDHLTAPADQPKLIPLGAPQMNLLLKEVRHNPLFLATVALLPPRAL